MRYNLMFPMRAVKHWNRWCEGAGIGDVARLVEEAGFDGFSMSEHPYPDREWLARGGHHAFDPFVSLSFAAAATTRIRLMTYILVSGYRSPYLTAKAAASFDLLSGGRFTLGTGAGYLKAEFEALGADFDRRGALLDEAIAAWKATWAGVDHDGPEFGVSGHVALPPPLTTGGPPIWIGGNGAAAQRRVVEVADGWMPMAASGEMAAITRARPLEDIDTLGDWIAKVNKRRAETGRERCRRRLRPVRSRPARQRRLREILRCSTATARRLRRGGRHVDHHRAGQQELHRLPHRHRLC